MIVVESIVQAPFFAVIEEMSGVTTPETVLEMTLVGPQGPPGNGILVLGATDPIPDGTPPGTVILRPSA